jgi:hypothetical protein
MLKPLLIAVSDQVLLGQNEFSWLLLPPLGVLAEDIAG